ncbi:uncharacterized FAD-linked oxidoreductase YvdP-like [Bradysia coprophila]|uniref:uncharacterized FAD-linked oxidoreductase YvdP-like n=1 Tax=Bradysia coprophila TaxID=38358 RepID=UPI00187DAE57|nr:uncharacterized FAD-linked oxidoreductase YvdP-like [Bradysia coprophila]
MAFKDDTDVYNALNYQWNKWGGHIEPMAYVVAKTNSDIRIATICCKLLNFRIVARGGGHSFDKRCFGDSRSLIVDMSAMNEISIDPSRMHWDVGAGAETAVITETLWNEGEYVAALGVCPTVGVTGLALGGGFGYFTRIFGLSSDNLVELQMIDANGNLQIINESTNDDLFWALRGGGGGSFGIVTKLKFRLYKAPKSVTFGNYFYHFDDFQQFYQAYQSLLSSPSIRNNFGLLLKMQHDIIEMEVYVMQFENADTMSVDIDQILGSFSFPKAIKSTLKLMSYPDFYLKTVQPYSPMTKLTTLSQLKEIDRHFPAAWMESKSMFVNKLLSREEISELYALMKPMLPYATLFFEHNGGAIDEHSRTETAFVHRNNLYSLQLDTLFVDFNYTANSAVNAFYDASKRLLNHQESYQNYVDPTMVDYLQRYYGENLERLIKIKTKYDPENLFRHQQSIPTADRSVSVLYM